MYAAEIDGLEVEETVSGMRVNEAKVCRSPKGTGEEGVLSVCPWVHFLAVHLKWACTSSGCGECRSHGNNVWMDKQTENNLCSHTLKLDSCR